jgi:ERF superfamily
MNVYKKLQQARLKLQSTPLKKSGKNKFAGYEYFELADFLPTIQTIFAEVGLCGTVSYGTELATLTIVDTDATEATQPNFVIFSSPMSTAELKGCHAIQNLGAVQTYLRRYLWVAAMEIVEHDALDATTGSDSKKAESTETSPTSVGNKVVWQFNKINVLSDPNDTETWIKDIISGTEEQLASCNNVASVMNTFKVNKSDYDRLKELSPETFKSLMEKFTEVKTKLEEKANG